MSNLTHYERYSKDLLKHRLPAQRAVQYLANRDKVLGQKDSSALWIRNMTKYRAAIGLDNGKEHHFTTARSNHDLSNFIQAFALELHDHWYSRFQPDREKPLSFNTTLLTEPVIVAMESLDPGWDRSTSVLKYHILSHERAGRRVYEVSEGLSAKLQHTELRGLTCEDLRLPFPSVYIAVPPSAGFQVHNHITGWHPVIGVYITEDKQASLAPVNSKLYADISDKDYVLRVIRPDGKEQKPPFPKGRQWQIMIVGGSKNPDDPLDDALYWFDLNLPDEGKLDDAINDVIAVHAGSEYREQLKATASEGVQKCFTEMEDVWAVIFRWCINVIVYATYSEPGELAYNDPVARKLWAQIEKMPPSRKRQGAINRFKSLGVQERRQLGRKVIVVDRERKLMEQAGTGRRGAITVRTLVCGHWRQVPYGPGRQHRRATFIEPFWRGPDEGVISQKTHLLK